MNTNQFHNLFVLPALSSLGESFNQPNARFLLLLTAAQESNMGEYYIQLGSRIARGPYQMEPETANSLMMNADALRRQEIIRVVNKMMLFEMKLRDQLIYSPLFATAMARIQYSTFPEAIPELTGNLELDIYRMWLVYKEQYNTYLGDTTMGEFTHSAKRHYVNYEVIGIE